MEQSGTDRAVRRWLMASAFAVAATVAVGGGTRLTESGLSITEWKPVTGVMPPLSGAQWDEAFRNYLAIPEAKTVHAGITLDEFKALFWWEWAHRLVARAVGLVIALPFVFFWWRGTFRGGLLWRMSLLPILVGAQGAMGWYMVASGLSVRTSVSQYRLVAHLGLALVIFAIAVWTAASLGQEDGTGAGGAHQGTVSSGDTSGRRPRSDQVRVNQRAALIALAVLVSVTILSGGFVAGLDAGKIFNEFPLMGGRIVPLGYDAVPGWRNWFENPVAAQFNHRVLAISTVLATWILWLTFRNRVPPRVARLTILAALAATVQLGLGIATILLAVPVTLGVAHQLGAVALLAVLLVAMEASFRNEAPTTRRT